jgi:hypothetical protein
MALIPTPRKDIKVNRFIVEAEEKQFIVTLHETPDTYTIYIGGKTKYCAEGFIIKRSSSLQYLQKNSARLSQVYYDKGCTIDEDFERGVDTRLIIKLLISFIHHYLPHITKIKLSDKSTRTCDNSVEIKLYQFSYIIYGKTWYEKNFNAYLEDDYLKYFSEKAEKFQAKKKELSWDIFKSFTINEFPIDENIIKDLYNKANSWQEFFEPLNKLMTPSKLCIFLAPWLDNFITSYMGFIFSSLEYTIPVEKNIISFTVTKYLHGGLRKYTYKKIRNSKKKI